MIQRAEQILKHTFGYHQFRGDQKEIIEAVIEGKDALVLMPTGGGKSLCYQIPALLSDGLAIVVSPLIALMQDQVSALQQLGVRAELLNSTLTPEQQSQVMRRIYDGDVDLLYIAPERLLQESTLHRMMQQQVNLIAIDEAHCVSQWGHDFRKEYLGLHVLQQAFPGIPKIALTATADQRTREEIVARLALNEAEKFVSSFDRPNIFYRVQPKGQAKTQLINFLREKKGQAGIVYCLSRNKVDGIAAWLEAREVKALPYHAGLSQQVRAENLRRFLREDAVVMVATIAFGMGIDKPDVRFVVHLDLPKNLEAYYQETGRAGRDGQAADTLMLYGLGDVVQQSRMIQSSQASEEQKRIEQQKVNSLLAWCEANTCRRAMLLGYFAEEYKAPCGHCDICLNPPKTWNATEAAQKILSNIYRTGQRFGVGHVLDVLLGKETDKVKQFKHNELSTYGIGSDRTEQQWRSILRQLIVQGFLLINDEQYGAIQLTEKSRSLLKGEVKLFLREELIIATAKKRERKSKVNHNITEQDRELWEALRECRKTLAEQQGVPPFHIFHDATLMEMMQHKPSNNAELLQINGIGEVKLERYGDDFLDVIKVHQR